MIEADWAGTESHDEQQAAHKGQIVHHQDHVVLPLLRVRICPEVVKRKSDRNEKQEERQACKSCFVTKQKGESRSDLDRGSRPEEEGDPEHAPFLHLGRRPRRIHDLHGAAKNEDVADENSRREGAVPLQRREPDIATSQCA